ncbi:MAG: GNAT family protein [Candidatus Sericytochromatia bacterium]
MIIKRIDEDISLKQLEKEDAIFLFELVNSNREYLKKWLPWLDTNKTIQDTEKFINISTEKYNGNKGFELGIWLKNEIVGVIGIHEINWDKGQTAIGYWIGEKYQGKGLVSKSVKFILDYCFTELELKKVYIRAAIQNTKSRNIPERLGFKFEGVRELAENLYGNIVDHSVYSITFEDYKKEN